MYPGATATPARAGGAPVPPLSYYIYRTMETQSLLLSLVFMLFAALVGGWILDRLRQPAIIGYILSGAVLGNVFMQGLPERHFFELGGELGLVFMLFFIGAQVDIPRLAQNWRIPVLGTTLTVAASVAVCLLLGRALGWTPRQSIFFGFVISLSSTAVVLRILEEFGGPNSPIGSRSLGILLFQDLLVIPMLILLGSFGGNAFDPWLLLRQLLGGAAVIAGAVFLARHPSLLAPRWLNLEGNSEFRVFAGLAFCLGAASLTGLLGLSPALGAFVGGVVLGRAEERLHLRASLEPFRVLFVAVFFMFVGLLVDLDFLARHWPVILGLVFAIFIVNTLLTAMVLRGLGVNLVESLATACLLAQIGEFAFLLAATAQGQHLIDRGIYQTTVSAIALSLLLTPIWLHAARRLMRASLGTSGTIAFQALPQNGRAHAHTGIPLTPSATED